jgi:alpha-D-ribose 1-methylphosphonate 5-triphosphate synthase subunit PhnH
MSVGQLLPGFDNPVLQSQASFRRIVSALATPGRVMCVGADVVSPGPLDPAATAVLLTLADYETAVWFSPTLMEAAAAVEHVRFHTSATVVMDPATASFAVVDLRNDGLSLGAFAQGSLEYPDRSTTLVVMTEGLEGGPARRITGPGIRHEADITVRGLPDDFNDQWAANRARFPLGVDILFTSGAMLVGLPRTSRILAENA